MIMIDNRMWSPLQQFEERHKEITQGLMRTACKQDGVKECMRLAHDTIQSILPIAHMSEALILLTLQKHVTNGLAWLTVELVM